MIALRSLAAAVVLMGGLLSSGCYGLPNTFTKGSGTLITQSFDIADFDGVSASHAFNVVITQGDAFSVHVTVDDNVVDLLTVENQDGTLVIALESGAYNNVTERAEITMPMLGGVKVSGAATATLEGFAGGMAFQGVASGASRITGDMSAARTVLDIAGASEVTLRGESDTLDAKASGASKLNLGELVVRSATLDLSGASFALVNASEEIDATAGGASHVEYIGNPATIRQDTSGASSVAQH